MPPPKARKIELTEKQRNILEHLMRCQKSPQRLVRRIKIVIEAANGLTNDHIAQKLRMIPQTVRRWRNRWPTAFAKLQAAEENPETKEKDLKKMIEACFDDAPRPGTPAKYTSEQIVQLIAVACENPEESGRPVSHWVAEEVADEAGKRNIVESISPRSVRRFFKRCGVATPSRKTLAQRKP